MALYTYMADTEHQLRFYIRHGHGIVQLTLFPKERTDTIHAVIHDLFVEKNYRRRGIAGQLINEAERIAASYGYTEIGLNYYSDQTPISVFEWYKRMGYEVATHPDKWSYSMIKKL